MISARQAFDSMCSQKGTPKTGSYEDLLRLFEEGWKAHALAVSHAAECEVRKKVERASKQNWIMAVRDHRMLTGSTLKEARCYVEAEFPGLIPS